ncbi:hypothetical protein [Dehalogenimonas alkenigignens]|nr:hypothetical protein [Dehalogenimonas alkenigignens]
MNTGEQGPNPNAKAYEHASDHARFKRPEVAKEKIKPNKNSKNQKHGKQK